MKLVYFEDEAGNAIAIAPKQIAAVKQKRPPTNTPTMILLANGVYYEVRNSFDDCLKRLEKTE